MGRTGRLQLDPEPVRFHGPDGVVFWPASEIALLREEWDGRLEATSRQGEVAWRPGPLQPLAAPPLVEVSPGVLVNPLHAQGVGDRLLLPGGWTLPAAPLPAVEPAPPADPDEPAALVFRRPKWIWITAAGERPGPKSLAEARRLYPDLVRAGPWHVRGSAVRRLEREGPRGRIVLAGGPEVRATWSTLDDLARALDLPFPDLAAELPVRHHPLYRRGLRDWPDELVRMEPAALREIAAGDAPRLLDLALWQIFRLRSQGRDLPYGRSPRGLYYNPVLLLAQRAGLLADPGEELETPFVPLALADLWRGSLPEVLSRGSLRERLWITLLGRLELFVGEWRLGTYAELGCTDEGSRNRRVGTRRPEVILLAEKGSLEADARAVAEGFDVSLLVMGGAPTYIASEYLAEALRGRVGGPVTLVSYCDFDPYGWHFPVAVAAQLERYGVATRAVHRLVQPKRFTEEELDFMAVPLPAGSAGRPEVERWFRETGGVRGRRLGLYADYLRPAARLAEAFREETGLEPGGPG